MCCVKKKLKMKILAIILLCFSAFSKAQEIQTNCNITNINDNGDIQCRSPNFPEKYEQGECYCNFDVEEGYKIEVIVENLNLDSTDKDNVEIKSEIDGKVFKYSWFLKNESRILIMGNKVNVKFTANKNVNSGTVDNPVGFSILLKRYGELTTTTERTTEMTLPTPAQNDSIYNTVYVAASSDDFRENQLEFRQLLANMTVIYCQKYNIPLAENVTEKNVEIDLAIICSIDWPDSDKCIKVRYAIPVVIENSSKYELTSENLEKMWNELVVNELNKLNWTVYKQPDNDYNMLLWLSVSLIILVVFFGFLFFIKAFSLRFSDHIKRRGSDVQQIIATPPRNSDASLYPSANNHIYPPAPYSENVSSQINTSSNMNESSDEEELYRRQNNSLGRAGFAYFEAPGAVEI